VKNAEPLKFGSPIRLESSCASADGTHGSDTANAASKPEIKAWILGLKNMLTILMCSKRQENNTAGMPP